MQGDGVDAFIRAICASPDDDLPRLVFADFLDESGHEGWAAFIRCQVEAHRLATAWGDGEDVDTKEMTRLQGRAATLFKGDAVPKAVYVPAVNRNYKFTNLNLWRRGFPARTASDHFTEWRWRECGHEVVKLVPLEHVTLSGMTPYHSTYYGWFDSTRTGFNGITPRADLCPELFDLLPEDEYKYDDPSLGRWWRADWQANNALSTAALRLVHSRNAQTTRTG